MPRVNVNSTLIYFGQIIINVLMNIVENFKIFFNEQISLMTLKMKFFVYKEK